MNAHLRRQAIRDNAPARLRRIGELRRMGAPLWVIKTEQVALALARRGLAHRPFAANKSQAQAELYTKHVLPLMEDRNVSSQ